MFKTPNTIVAPVIDRTIEALWDNNTSSQNFAKMILPTVTDASDLSGTFKAY